MVDRTIAAAKVAAILASAAGFRNLVADQYGVLDPLRVHAMATSELGDLLDFCEVVGRAVGTD